MNYYEEKQYTDDELIVRIMDKEAIKKLMARRAFYYANNQRRRELDELWVSTREYRDSASYGRNWGYYVGMDSIANYYVLEHTKKQYADLAAIHENDPSVAVDNQNLGLGLHCVPHSHNPHALYCGSTGKRPVGCGTTAGQETIMPGGRHRKSLLDHGYMYCGLCQGKRQLEDLASGGVQSDSIVEAGRTSNARGPLTGPDPFRDEFGTPDIPMTVHNPRYNLSDNYPPMPLPYETYTVAGSLAPQGHPNYKKEVAKR